MSGSPALRGLSATVEAFVASGADRPLSDQQGPTRNGKIHGRSRAAYASDYTQEKSCAPI